MRTNECMNEYEMPTWTAVLYGSCIRSSIRLFAHQLRNLANVWQLLAIITEAYPVVYSGCLLRLSIPVRRAMHQSHRDTSLRSDGAGR